MRMSLFSRLALGYLAIFTLVTAVSVYALLQLDRFGELTESILRVDNRVLDYQKNLVDLLLAQSRYEQKFAITKDEALYRQFARLKKEFESQLASVSTLEEAVSTELLMQILLDYGRYEHLVADEAENLRKKKSYSQAKYKEEKDNLIDRILTSLEKVKTDRQQSIFQKVKELAETVGQAREFSLIISAAALLAIVLMCLFLTRSITRPIAMLKDKTKEIAEGHFESRVQVNAPQEISELAMAFNRMCEKLNELEQLKADFYASMSHELRTPLTSIKEGTGLLLDGVGGETTERQRKLLTIVAEESNRLIGVVSSLLDLSKMEAGMMRYNFETVAFDPLIQRALAEITPLAEAKQICLESTTEASLPAARVDAERILQALRNLLGNAVKFTPNGGRVKILAKSANGKLTISVRDSGPGIPKESLTAIFEKFSQGNHKGTQRQLGTGLGLAIAKNIIESHGGHIWVDSKVGEGSTFTFVLPC